MTISKDLDSVARYLIDAGTQRRFVVLQLLLLPFQKFTDNVVGYVYFNIPVRLLLDSLYDIQLPSLLSFGRRLRYCRECHGPGKQYRCD